MNYENKPDVAKNFFRLMLLIHAKTASFHEFTKSSTIPPSQVKILFFLENKGPSSVSKIANFLEISKPNMTPLIDNLIQGEYVIRYSDPKDRRIIIIETTSKGKDFIKNEKLKLKKKFAEKLDSLSEEDLLKLNDHLLQMSDILNKLD